MTAANVAFARRGTRPSRSTCSPAVVGDDASPGRGRTPSPGTAGRRTSPRRGAACASALRSASFGLAQNSRSSASLGSPSLLWSREQLVEQHGQLDSGSRPSGRLARCCVAGRRACGLILRELRLVDRQLASATLAAGSSNSAIAGSFGMQYSSRHARSSRHLPSRFTGQYRSMSTNRKNRSSLVVLQRLRRGRRCRCRRAPGASSTPGRGAAASSASANRRTSFCSSRQRRRLGSSGSGTGKNAGPVAVEQLVVLLRLHVRPEEEADARRRRCTYASRFFAAGSGTRGHVHMRRAVNGRRSRRRGLASVAVHPVEAADGRL